ncbi:hypothetical protein D1610_04500 [Sphingomonas gilva]|uniref:Pentapeptide MXKDX repeat protein n=1 Tax=Sphingomonas gilva TaxID=2305907 RepID=A0A396RS28_9SPHN|nr:hypothetical protein [Sphingomonas gilva]RHW19368.1 hypothetical protein D1610_04500 [Sphingomonas gilva]
MRAILSKVVTGSMIAGAALLVSACGESTPADTSVDNTMVTDMNAMEPMDGTMTDNMTSVDGAMANDGMMANDTMMSNDMMANDTMTNAM